MEARGWHQGSSTTILCFLYWSENSHLNLDLVNPAVWLAADPEAPLSLSSSLWDYGWVTTNPTRHLHVWWKPGLPQVCSPLILLSSLLSACLWYGNKLQQTYLLVVLLLCRISFDILGHHFDLFQEMFELFFLISFLLLGFSKIAYFSAVEMAQKLRALTPPPLVPSSTPSTHMVGNYHL